MEPESYDSYVRRLAAAMPAVPSLTVTYSGLSLTLRGSKANGGAPGTEFRALDGVTGVLPAGSLTLVLGPPGHGKTTLLRAVGQRPLPRPLAGELRYGGLTPADCDRAGVCLARVVGFAPQSDELFTELTVAETLQFAAETTRAPLTADVSSEAAELTGREVGELTRMLRLSECVNTIVGSEMARGISGGQRKRVTIAEALIGRPRLLVLDEVTTGLDAAVAYEMLENLRTWARATGGTIIAALLQPTPEIYGLFDHVILMRDGCEVFHGPRTALPEYLAAAGWSVSPHQDIADWVLEWLTDPAKALGRQLHAQQAAVAAGGAGVGEGAAVALKQPVIATREMVAAWQAHPLYAAQRDPAAAAAAPGATPTLTLQSDFARSQYGRRYVRTIASYAHSIFARQTRLVLRNHILLITLPLANVVTALIMGSLFWKMGRDAVGDKAGCLFYILTHLGFVGNAEISVLFAARRVLQRQIDGGWYPGFLFPVAHILWAIPRALLECALFMSVIYFMLGLSLSPGAFFTQCAIVLMAQLSTSAWLRLVAFSTPTLELANTLGMPVASFMCIFAGFLLTPEEIPRWLLGAYWAAPMSWLLRASLRVELNDPAYDVVLPTGRKLGDEYLQQFGMRTEQMWIGLAFAFALGYYFLGMALSGLATTYLRQAAWEVGTSRQALEPLEDGGDVVARQDSFAPAAGGAKAASGAAHPADASIAAAAAAAVTAGEVAVSVVSEGKAAAGAADVAAGAADVAAGAAVVPVAKPATSAAGLPAPSPLHGGTGMTTSHALPFTPVTLTFSNVRYRVTLTRQAGGGERTLLRGVSGYALPGEVTMLMGASGAGKTTLLDAISGRKNTGVLEGDVFVNGRPRDAAFYRQCAYVEQQDIHSPFMTVREALDFSASLRLPPGIPAAQRRAFVAEVLQVLELDDCADRLVGGLSPSQLKRVSIGVELASNNPIIALDEPTSFLDSRSALRVMRVIHKLASVLGRTVIATIHQPSAEIFSLGDRLLLLQTGGWQVYFGPLGRDARDVVRFMERQGDVQRCAGDTNPATYMLEVLAGVPQADAVGATADTAITAATGTAKPRVEAAGVDVAGPLSTAASSRPLVAGALTTGSMGTGAFPAAPGAPATATTAAATAAATAPPPAKLRIDWHGAYFGSELAAGNAGDIARLASRDAYTGTAAAPAPVPTSTAHSPLSQLLSLLGRTWRVYYRNAGYTLGRMAVFFVLALVEGILYYQLSGNGYGAVRSKAALLFLVVSFGGVLSYTIAMAPSFAERPLMYKERFSRTYHPALYALSVFLVEMPWLVATSLLYSVVVYWMVGLLADAATFFHFFLVTLLTLTCFTNLGLWFSWLWSTPEVAQVVGGLFVALAFIFAGLLIPGPSIPVWWKWVYYCNPASYAVEALTSPQFNCDGPAAQCPSLTLVDGGTVRTVVISQYITTYFGFEYGDRWPDVGWLTLFAGALALAGILSASAISWVKR